MKAPLFIVFEGIDGAGKSSQLRRLSARFLEADREVVHLAEPTDGPHGSEIRRRARNGPPLAPQEELDLFVADRREHVAGSIRPALAAGKVVLQDRYFYSTAAYQAARPVLGLTPADVVAMHEWAPAPDLVVVLDLAVSAGLARVERRGAGDAFEHEALQSRVRAHFLEMAGADPERFVVVDASRSEEEVAAEIWERVGPLVDR